MLDTNPFVSPRSNTRNLVAVELALAMVFNSLGIELDPRDTSEAQVRVLADLGFGSLSVGVQDFAPNVQATINRLQSAKQTAELIASARVAGFTSIGVDLVYGLPGQSTDSLARTVDEVAAMAPDRVALFGYAHLPHLRPHQRLVERQPIPDVSHRADLLCTAIAGLTRKGYQRAGFDHFARPGDPLAIAARNGSLHRNFQGFTNARGGPLIACGVTGISEGSASGFADLAAIVRFNNQGYIDARSGSSYAASTVPYSAHTWKYRSGTGIVSPPP